MQVNSKLAHLSAEQLVDLLEKYGNQSIPLKDIISEFSIQTTPSALNALLPPLIHEEAPCPYCVDVFLQSRRPNRSGYTSPIRRCPNCGHQNTDYCLCLNCRESAAKKRQWIEEIKRDLIRDDYGGRHYDDNFKCVTLRDAVYLSALIRQSLSEDLAVVDPYAPGPPLLAPTGDHMREITMHLQGKVLLAVDPESPIDAFVFNEELTEAHSYYPAKVDWLFLPGLAPASKRQFIADLTAAIDNNWPDAWQNDMPSLWREIIKVEAFEYFFHLLDQRGYQLDKIGEKTHAVFDFLIERFPLSKIYNLMWQAVRDVTDYNVKNDIPTYRAKNNFVGAIQRKAEKYIAQGWDLKDSRRDFDCPQTWISSTFFDTFMKVGEDGFTSMPPPESD
ncbi:hypothetical protein HUO14_08920 [Parasphingorhabdus flavimaris]|uniref:Uncharacterized protein n=1 Tax=Parasphingorhabdus flavimaris TaxID=266812 RepID=A0ABX2N2V8_9SPHN|nr:hypothetical protein [Parasphingorhabdus flavimaris]NVD28023.1 hypothetical protein [Parasphingorhabdus flavimaris]|tara:strand:- start:2368 stop:3534 length:1167 start_codon:yes stop_codon:yes gene_type:complete